MLKRFCDFCNVEINLHFPDLDRDSKTQYYTIIKHIGDTFENESDICNNCLKKIIEGTKR